MVYQYQGTNQWIRCYWEESFEQQELAQQPGHIADGVLLIPPPVVDITFSDGLWTHLNNILGTMFDMWEEEVIAHPHTINNIATLIAEFSKLHYENGDKMISVVAGWKVDLDRTPIVAHMSAQTLADWLKELTAFLVDAAVRRKTVIIAL